MKKICLIVFGLAANTLVGSGEKEADPEALHQEYLRDVSAREKKIKECNLMSTDEQAKNQACQVARNAEKEIAHQQLKKRGFIDFKPVEGRMGSEKEQNKKE